MRALVTGATGLIGSHIVRTLLEDGQEVRAVVRQGSDDRNLRGLDVERVALDVRDADAVNGAVRGCQTVYHAAAKVAFWVPPRERPAFYDVNVGGTRNVLAAAMRRDVEKVVYTSTISAIGSRGGETATTEEDFYTLWDIATDYEHSKLAAEFEVWRFAARGLPVVAVLPTAPIGSQDRTPNPVGQIVLDFLARRLPLIDGGLNVIDVEDVAAGHLLAARHGRPGERYILGDANVTVSQLFAVLAEVSGVPAPRVRLPRPLALGLGFGLQFISDHVTRRHPLLTPSMVRLATMHYYADSSKAKRELGFEPRSDPRRGAAKAICWFIDHGYVKFRRARQASVYARAAAAAAGT